MILFLLSFALFAGVSWLAHLVVEEIDWQLTKRRIERRWKAEGR